MKTFYLIQDGKAQVGQGTIVPSDFIEYKLGEEPKELLEALEAEKVAMELQAKNSEALTALNSGDWKVIRELERKFLADTELNKEREALREMVK